MTENLTSGDLMRAAVNILAATSATPALDAEVLLAHALGTTRARLQSHMNDECGADARRTFERLLERRAAGEPVAYVVGCKEFWSLPFIVNDAVLVPRPETELLVERALDLGGEATVRALDLGTGAGVIGLALAQERPRWQIAASDVSAAALAVARANASALGLPQVEFLWGAWFEPLSGRRFELILSNPPYVAADDPALLATSLRFEPRSALSPGLDAFAALRLIIRAAPAYLARGGWLLLEHGATQADEVARELVVRGFRHVRSQRDLAGHDRMTEAQWGEPFPQET